MKTTLKLTDREMGLLSAALITLKAESKSTTIKRKCQELISKVGEAWGATHELKILEDIKNK